MTNNMEQSRSLEADRRSAVNRIACFLWNSEVHFRVHKSPIYFRAQQQLESVRLI
jgi:hypothetical protein